MTVSQRIVSTPGTCGGKPRIAGHRIRVQDVVVCHEALGLCPEEIVASYPGLTLADVHAALAYYLGHRDQVLKDMEEDEAFVAAFEKEHAAAILRLNGCGRR
jgi:uncharacterized protein (DUF433 family)